jgi:hypothetical protein
MQLKQCHVALHHILEGNNRSIGHLRAFQAKKLPPVVVEIVRHMQDRPPVKDDAAERNHRAVWRLIERPGLVHSLISDIFRIDAAGFGNIFGAADHGAAVGEDGELILANRRPDEVFVPGYLADRGEFVG